jgi:hypothetical protein
MVLSDHLSSLARLEAPFPFLASKANKHMIFILTTDFITHIINMLEKFLEEVLWWYMA